MPILVLVVQKYCQFLHYSIHFPCSKACQIDVQQHKIKAHDTDAVFSTKLNIDYLLKIAEKRRSYVIIVWIPHLMMMVERKIYDGVYAS